ncbi:MAG: pilus assembly PilX N-terminal domain-containing protein [Desulfuromonadaceae bacterium]|nr:pilus assembly PilX N-terminal domain-containing protein [Desulfuromonadaceae bacterium]
MYNTNNENGSALITALIILTLLTVLGLAATNTSMLETMIASTERTHAEAFYAAEGGIEHLRRNFKNIFVEKNAARMAAGQDPNWDFALASASAANYAGGAEWIVDGDMGSRYLYNVRVWNNNDGGTYLEDKDGIIFMRAEAEGPNGAFAAVEVTLAGGASDGEALSGYGAQEGGGSGKNYNANDVNPMGDFSSQIK